jgi:RimJ/RimL family protein N-acetyltransferase
MIEEKIAVNKAPLQTYTKKLRIIGQKVDLVRSTMEHINPLYEQIMSSGVLDNLTIEIEQLDDFRRYLIFVQNQWALNADFTYTILEKASNRPIGQTSLYNLSFRHQRAEVGIWVGSSYWRHGLGSETLGLLCEYAFEGLHINRLEAHIFLTNTASMKIFEKHGFRQEGINCQYVKRNGVFIDVYCYAAFSSIWRLTNGKTKV